MTRGIVLMSLVGLLALAAPGCRSAALDQERLLAAAGFQMKFADTPEKKQQIAALPQRKLVPVPPGEGGNPKFVWADLEYCNCMYAGTEQAYDRYQKLAAKQRIANEQLAAAEDAQDAEMNWELWGPWGPWW